MAPKNGRGKTKGDKKKKEERGLSLSLSVIELSSFNYVHILFFFVVYCAVLPVVVDIKVNLPDETHVILKVCTTSNKISHCSN